MKVLKHSVIRIEIPILIHNHWNVEYLKWGENEYSKKRDSRNFGPEINDPSCRGNVAQRCGNFLRSFKKFVPKSLFLIHSHWNVLYLKRGENEYCKERNSRNFAPEINDPRLQRECRVTVWQFLEKFLKISVYVPRSPHFNIERFERYTFET